MYILSFQYKKEGLSKVAVCIYHHFNIKRKNKKSCSMYILSLHYNKQGLRKVAVCIYHHFIIKRKDEEKLQFV